MVLWPQFHDFDEFCVLGARWYKAFPMTYQYLSKYIVVFLFEAIQNLFWGFSVVGARLHKAFPMTYQYIWEDIVMFFEALQYSL